MAPAREHEGPLGGAGRRAHPGGRAAGLARPEEVGRRRLRLQRRPDVPDEVLHTLTPLARSAAWILLVGCSGATPASRRPVAQGPASPPPAPAMASDPQTDEDSGALDASEEPLGIDDPMVLH